MNIIFSDRTDRKIADSEYRIEELRRSARVAEVEVARDTDLATICSSKGWENACKIFESERIRLALLHVKTTDKEEQLQIRGQCLQMELLSGKSEEVEARLVNSMRNLAGINDSIAEERNKINALRSKK